MKELFASNSPNGKLLTFQVLRDLLMNSKKIKKYQKHILYKILVILRGKGRSSSQKYVLYDDALFGELDPDTDKKQIHVLSFMTVYSSI